MDCILEVTARLVETHLSFWMLEEIPERRYIPSTTPCFSMNSVQLLITWGTEGDQAVRDSREHLSVHSSSKVNGQSIDARQGERLTLMTRVEEVFPQVTAKHPLPEYPPLPQLLRGRARLHEGPQERDQLAVLLAH